MVDAEHLADLCSELVSVWPAHHLRVDCEGDGRVGVADLCLHVGGVEAGGDGVGDVGAPEGVGCHVCPNGRLARRARLSFARATTGSTTFCRTLSLFRRVPRLVGKGGS